MIFRIGNYISDTGTIHFKTGTDSRGVIAVMDNIEKPIGTSDVLNGGNISRFLELFSGDVSKLLENAKVIDLKYVFANSIGYFAKEEVIWKQF